MVESKLGGEFPRQSQDWRMTYDVGYSSGTWHFGSCEEKRAHDQACSTINKLGSQKTLGPSRYQQLLHCHHLHQLYSTGTYPTARPFGPAVAIRHTPGLNWLDTSHFPGCLQIRQHDPLLQSRKSLILLQPTSHHPPTLNCNPALDLESNMPSLIYAPVSTLNLPQLSLHAVANYAMIIGVPPTCFGDEHVHAAHRSLAIYLEAQALHLHFRESVSSEITIWDQG